MRTCAMSWMTSTAPSDWLGRQSDELERQGETGQRSTMVGLEAWILALLEQG